MTKTLSAAKSANLGILNAVADLSGTEPAYDSPDEYFIHVTGTFVGTVTFQGSVDGINWFDLRTENSATGAIAASTTTPVAVVVNKFPLFVRAIMSAYTSGTAVVSWSEMKIKPA